MSDNLETSAPHPAGISDVDLADEILDTTLVLSLGAEDGIAPGVAAALRRSRLEALHELLKRWKAE